MNIEKLTKLKAFFDDGAPHFHLDMNLPLGDTQEPEIQRYLDDPVPETCGTAGCIAGAVCMLFEPNPPRHLPPGDQWDTVAPIAARHLGFEDDGHNFFIHDLFNSELAPPGCTAKQASQAIQNVIEGKQPWT